MRRTLSLSVIAVTLSVALFYRSTPANAGVEWCIFDPLLTVNGQQIHLTIGVLTDNPSTVIASGLLVSVPENARVTLEGANTGRPIGRFNTYVGLVRTPATSGPVHVTAVSTVVATSAVPVELIASTGLDGTGTVIRREVGTSTVYVPGTLPSSLPTVSIDFTVPAR